MIISDEQARLAAQCLRNTHKQTGKAPGPHTLVDEELVRRVSRALDYVPETSEERIAAAREMLDRLPSSTEVAGKILGRAVSDSLR